MDSELESPAGELLLVGFDPGGAHYVFRAQSRFTSTFFSPSSPLKQQVEPLPTPNLREA